jgi:peptide deformylase
MAVRDILQYPDPSLKQPSAPVTMFDGTLRTLLQDLEDTVRAFPGSVGVSAPQIGECLRVVIVDLSAKPDVPQHGCLRLVNPEIVRREGEVKGREGCMSVPHYTGNVWRAASIQLRAQDEEGQWHEWDCQGYEARAIQHELDHLDGVLFLDRVVSARHDLFRRKVYR